MIHTMLFMYGYNKYPKKSVASNGNCVGILSIEHTKTPGPEKLTMGERERINIYANLDNILTLKNIFK